MRLGAKKFMTQGGKNSGASYIVGRNDVVARKNMAT